MVMGMLHISEVSTVQVQAGPLVGAQIPISDPGVLAPSKIPTRPHQNKVVGFGQRLWPLYMNIIIMSLCVRNKPSWALESAG
jgi:hypothetical protein